MMVGWFGGNTYNVSSVKAYEKPCSEAPRQGCAPALFLNVLHLDLMFFLLQLTGLKLRTQQCCAWDSELIGNKSVRIMQHGANKVQRHGSAQDRERLTASNTDREVRTVGSH